MEQLVGLLDLLLKGEHVGLIGIMRPPQMPKVIMNEKVYELGSKQKVWSSIHGSSSTWLTSCNSNWKRARSNFHKPLKSCELAYKKKIIILTR